MHEAIIEKFKKEVVFRCDYHDIEKLIEQHFGFKEYSIPCEEELGNDISLDYLLDGELNDYEAKEVAAMLVSGKPRQFATRLLLEYLVSLEILDKGRYIIRISW